MRNGGKMWNKKKSLPEMYLRIDKEYMIEYAWRMFE